MRFDEFVPIANEAVFPKDVAMRSVLLAMFDSDEAEPMDLVRRLRETAWALEVIADKVSRVISASSTQK